MLAQTQWDSRFSLSSIAPAHPQYRSRISSLSRTSKFAGLKALCFPHIRKNGGEVAPSQSGNRSTPNTSASLATAPTLPSLTFPLLSSCTIQNGHHLSGLDNTNVIHRNVFHNEQLLPIEKVRL